MLPCVEMSCDVSRFKNASKKLILFGFFYLSTHQVRAEHKSASELKCFKILRFKEKIAQEFETSFLPKIQKVEAPKNSMVDPLILEEVIRNVDDSVLFTLANQARDFLFYFNPKGATDFSEHAVRLAYSKYQYFNFDQASFIRFFPENIVLSQLLGALKEAITRRNFIPHEAVLSRRDQVSPELVGETDLIFEDQVVSLRFAIVIPRSDPQRPVLTLLSPLITPRTTGKIVGIYLSPYNSEDHLVISNWKKGKPLEGAVIKRSEVLARASLSDNFSNINLSVQDKNSWEGFVNLIHYFHKFYEVSFQRLFEGRFKNNIIQTLARVEGFEFSSSLRNQMAPFPYFGYKKETDIEHASVQRAVPIFLKQKTKDFYSVNFFPESLDREQIFESLKNNILRSQFAIAPRSREFPNSIVIYSRLRIGDHDYPVEAILALPNSIEDRVKLISLHPVIDSEMTNPVVSVFYDAKKEKYMVVTDWKQGLPEKGIFISK
jgi:hypothetical protein